MGDAFKKAQDGKPLIIPAAAYNSFLDAAQDFKSRQQSRGRKSLRKFRQADLFPVRNETSEDLGQFAIVGIASPIITPTDNEDEFRNRVSLRGLTPDDSLHVGKFAILQEPAAQNEIAQAAIAGVSVCKVYVDDEDHDRAEMADGVTGYLQSGSTGSATILWKEEGTGEKWAVIRIGASNLPAPAVAVEPYTLIKESGASGYGGWVFSPDYPGSLRTYGYLNLSGRPVGAIGDPRDAGVTFYKYSDYGDFDEDGFCRLDRAGLWRLAFHAAIYGYWYGTPEPADVEAYWYGSKYVVGFAHHTHGGAVAEDGAHQFTQEGRWNRVVPIMPIQITLYGRETGEHDWEALDGVHGHLLWHYGDAANWHGLFVDKTFLIDAPTNTYELKILYQAIDNTSLFVNTNPPHIQDNDQPRCVINGMYGDTTSTDLLQLQWTGATRTEPTSP